MKQGKLRCGAWTAGVSAIVLFGSMFGDWYGVKAVNTSNLLFSIQSAESGNSAWEALDYLPYVLLVVVVSTLAVVALRLTNMLRRFATRAIGVVIMGGISSVLLIGFRIAKPPILAIERTVTYEGTVQAPIVLALLAAVGIVLGGVMAIPQDSIARTRARGLTRCVSASR